MYQCHILNFIWSLIINHVKGGKIIYKLYIFTIKNINNTYINTSLFVVTNNQNIRAIICHELKFRKNAIKIVANKNFTDIPYLTQTIF